MCNVKRNERVSHVIWSFWFSGLYSFQLSGLADAQVILSMGIIIPNGILISEELAFHIVVWSSLTRKLTAQLDLNHSTAIA